MTTMCLTNSLEFTQSLHSLTIIKLHSISWLSLISSTFHFNLDLHLPNRPSLLTNNVFLLLILLIPVSFSYFLLAFCCQDYHHTVFSEG